MKSDPGNPYATFDFFVAAEHIVEWRYPTDTAAQKGVRAHDPGKTVSHIANGAKHFEATATQHTSVADLSREDDYGTSLLGRAHWGEMVYGSTGRPALIVTMADGRRVDALELAELALTYWTTELGPGGTHEQP
jgi:hypothetical protein